VISQPAASPRLTYTVEEAAQLTGVGRTTLFNEIAAGHLPSVAIGRKGRGAGRRLILRDDLVAWLQLHRTAAA
jgi:excisionase family DNA binding protein